MTPVVPVMPSRAKPPRLAPLGTTGTTDQPPSPRPARSVTATRHREDRTPTHQEGVPVMTAAPQLDVQLYKVPDAMRMLNLSRTVIFELLRTGRLRSVKQGRTRLIPASAIQDYIALLEREAEAIR